MSKEEQNDFKRNHNTGTKRSHDSTIIPQNVQNSIISAVQQASTDNMSQMTDRSSNNDTPQTAGDSFGGRQEASFQRGSKKVKLNISSFDAYFLLHKHCLYTLFL